MRVQLQGKPQNSSYQRYRHIPWIRLLVVVFVSILCGFSALLLILSTGHIISSYWYYILPTIFTVIGLIIPLLQWLFLLASNESKPSINQVQPLAQRPLLSHANNLSNTSIPANQYSYDVALSYAGEDHDYADALANILYSRGVKVFYDKQEKATLWGKNLYTYLSDLYQNKAHYCVMFLSQHYADKLWTNFEREAAQARAFHEHEEYILPIRLDNTEIPGILPTTAYLNWHQETVETITDTIQAKLASH